MNRRDLLKALAIAPVAAPAVMQGALARGGMFQGVAGKALVGEMTAGETVMSASAVRRLRLSVKMDPAFCRIVDAVNEANRLATLYQSTPGDLSVAAQMHEHGIFAEAA